MSVFQVQLNNIGQGVMDLNPATGGQMRPSLQRSMWVTGPKNSYRELFDGQTFTDNNYWKRFCYPQVPLDQAILVCTTDDGSVYSEVASENTFPRVYSVTVDGGSIYTANVIDVVGDNGGPAYSASLENTSEQGVKVKMNGLSTAIFDLAGEASKSFDLGDAPITRLEFNNTSSGATTATIEVILMIRSSTGTAAAGAVEDYLDAA